MESGKLKVVWHTIDMSKLTDYPYSTAIAGLQYKDHNKSEVFKDTPFHEEMKKVCRQIQEDINELKNRDLLWNTLFNLWELLYYEFLC